MQGDTTELENLANHFAEDMILYVNDVEKKIKKHFKKKPGLEKERTSAIHEHENQTLSSPTVS